MWVPELTKRDTVKGPDKNELSARFPLATSVASSWVIAAVGVVVDQLLGSQLLTYQVPLWLALSLGLTGLSIVSATLLPRRKDQRSMENDQVFFILCAFNEKRWVADLTRDLHNSLDRRGFELVLKAPDRDYVHLGQVRHLRNLSERHDRYVGGIISPAEPELLRHDVRAYCTSAAHPTIFVDIDPFGAAEDYPPNTAFVGYSPDIIGRCAADYVAEHAGRSQTASPSVLVIGTDKLHVGRQTEFVKQLKLRLQDAKFIVNENGDFNRARAREIVHENLQSDHHATPNYIYCTNDEMALGAVDALSLMGKSDGSVVVVGVDGIPEARALIDSQNTPLRATVVQDSCRMAEIATDLLDKAIRGERIEKYNYLNPQIYSKDRGLG